MSATMGADRVALVPNRRTLLWGLPALLAFVYVIAVLVNFGSVITTINMNGDVVIAPVLAKLLGQAPAGSQVVLGNHPYYEEFLFLRATAGLPFFRPLWDVAPMLWTLGGVAILAWSARVALGGFAALLTASAVICLGALGRLSFFAFDWHGLSVLHTVVIGAVLVWLAPRAAEMGWRPLLGVAAVLGLFSALPVASDKLFPFWALIPLCASAALIAWRGSGRVRATLPAFALVTTAVAAVAGVLVAHVMRSNGITATPVGFTFLVPGTIVSHFELLLEGYMSLGGGYFLGLRPGFLASAVFASGALVVAALVLGLVQVRRLSALAGPRPVAGQRPSPKLAYVSFWASSLVIQSAVFIGTTAPQDTGSSRYVLAGYVAIAALIPLLALRGPGWRLAVTAGVSVFALSSIYQLVRQPFAPGGWPRPPTATRLLRYAQSEGVRYGYADYWDAPDLTWLTNFKLKVYPVLSGCGRVGLCRFPTAHIDTWYHPRAGVRSMLIADPRQASVTTIDPRLGPPVATTTIDNLKVAVYPFDIASKL